MFMSLAASPPVHGEPPNAARHRSPWNRLRFLLAFASALLLNMTLRLTSQTAYAVTNLDGQWTIVHGGTGQLALKADGSYTSTCHVQPNYVDAWCPAARRHL